MSASFYHGAKPSVEGWLDGQYEYMVPDKDINTMGKPSHIPRDAYRDTTPGSSDGNSSRGRGPRYPREQLHSTAKDRYTPASPPPEEDLERERTRHRHGAEQTHRGDRGHEIDRDERRPRYESDAKYPPKAEHGRPRRPPLNTATTSPHLTSGQPARDEDDTRPRRRRYSHGSPPPRHREDKSSRPHHSRRYEDRSPSPMPRSSRKRDAHDRDVRDRDARSHHSGGSGSNHGAPSSKKPQRPSLSHSQTAPYGKDPKKARGSSSGRSFSFLNDPRFMTAAEAALTAGATAAFAPGGGKWDGDKGAKVLRAGLGAAALSALKGSATSHEPEPAAAAPAPEPAPAPAPAPAAAAVETPGASAGRYVGNHMGRKGTTRRRHH